jgi:hypothetical protein
VNQPIGDRAMELRISWGRKMKDKQVRNEVNSLAQNGDIMVASATISVAAITIDQILVI